MFEEAVSNKQDEISYLSEAVRETFNKLEGLNAIAVYFPKQKIIVAFRNGSPLVLGIGEDEYFVASDVPAFLPYTRKVSYLADGEGAVLSSSRFEIIDSKSGSVKEPEIEEISWSVEEADKGKHPHYMIKEIKEQSQVLSHLAEYPKKEIDGVAKLIAESSNILLTACGTAAHAAYGATYFFSKVLKKPTNFSVGSEFDLLEGFLAPKSLLIAASQSGETMDTLEAVRAAKKHGAKTVALVNVPGSSLTRLADKTLLLNCGPEKAVVSTKAYTAKLAVFLLLAMVMVGELESGRRLIRGATRGIEGMLREKLEGQVQKLAASLKNVEHIYVIGRGINYPTALEAALKIKEASYIHAEGFAGGELKHGVIALIEKGTPCLVFAANDENKASILSNAKELKSRGGFIIGISPEKNEVFDEWIKVPDIGPAFPIANIVPVQLLAYHLALARGLDPDKPRNLAKSVTVK